MAKLNFDYMSAYNFMPFGPEGIEVDFKNYGNVVLVTGTNKDVAPSDESAENYRNGVGKSSIAEILVYTLFGKTIKKKGKVHQKDVINNISKRGLRTEVRWGDYRVVRKRKPDALELWIKHNDVADESKIEVVNGQRYLDISLGGMPATQGEIEKILGVNYHTFVNLVVFTDDLSSNFLECDAASKRTLVENLLGLDQYRAYTDTAKKIRNKKKEEQKVLSQSFESATLEVDKCKRRLSSVEMDEKNWIVNIENAKTEISNRISKLQSDILALDDDKDLQIYNSSREELKKCQDDIIPLNNSLQELDRIAGIGNSKLKDLNGVISLKNTEINSLQDQINAKQSEINLKRNAISDLNSNKNNIDYAISVANREAESARNKLEKCNHDIETMSSTKGHECDKCFGIIGDENVERYKTRQMEDVRSHENTIQLSEIKVEELSSQLGPINKNIEELNGEIASILESSKVISDSITLVRDEISKLQAQCDKINAGMPKIESRKNDANRQINELQSKIQELSAMKPPESETKRQLLHQEIGQLKDNIASKDNELLSSPYKKIMESAKEEIVVAERAHESKREELEEATKMLPYYEYWVKAFGDTGIRKFIIDRIIPGLNERVAHWMQHLIGGKIKLTFDNELNETISRNPENGDCFVYDTMSGGERRRLNLSVSQSFANIASISSGCLPSLVFLDEVTLNVDESGIVGIYNMITELSSNRQVFVTTHERSLLDMLSGCEEINIEKRNGFSRLIKTEA